MSRSRLPVHRKGILLDLGDQFRAASKIEAFSQIASDMLGNELGADRAGYAAIDQARGAFTIECDWAPDGAASIVGRHELSIFGATIRRLGDGEPIAVRDITTEQWIALDAVGYRALGVMSMIMVPSIDRGELVGALFIHAAEPRQWDLEELDLASSIADSTYAAAARFRAEADLRLANLELIHRLKNTLTTVQSIARQTLREVTEEAALAAFEGRLVALGHVHESLIQRNWASARIADVVGNILDTHAPVDRIDLTGPEFTLGSHAVLSLSMLLHELATNATKYGALSSQYGKISVAWRLAASADEFELVFDWKERGGPPATMPKRFGFGTRLIKAGLAGAGRTQQRYLPTGFEAEFRAPVARLQKN